MPTPAAAANAAAVVAPPNREIAAPTWHARTMPLPNPFDLTGRVAIVTGAAGGIGLAAARVLAEAGARVVLTDVQADLLAAETASLVEDGLACESAVLDVSKSSDVDELVTDVASRHGRLDVMV